MIALALLAVPGGINDILSACRVPFAHISWQEMRTPPPYTGSEPLKSFRLEVCANVIYTFGFEGMNFGVTTGFYPTQIADFRRFGGHFDIELDVEGKWVPLASFGYAVPDAVDPGFVPAFDGVLDYAGTSGITVTRQAQMAFNQSFVVTDPTFFTQAYTLRVTAGGIRPGDLGPGVPVATVVGSGAYQTDTSAVASAAVVLHWNQ